MASYQQGLARVPQVKSKPGWSGLGQVSALVQSAEAGSLVPPSLRGPEGRKEEMNEC